MLLLAGIILWATFRWREQPLMMLRNRWWLALLLAASVPLTATLFGLRLPDGTQPMPGVPFDAGAPALMFFAALPWLLAGGILGPVPAVLLGAFSGLMVGYFDSHNPFTVLEMAGLALVFSVVVRQRYRTLPFRLLRHPLIAAVLTAAAFTPVFLVTNLFISRGDVAVRMDYALNQTWQVFLVRGIEMVLAGLVCEVIYLARANFWGRSGPLLPSPSETSIQARFLLGSLPLVVMLGLTLTIGDWLVAGGVARRLLDDRMRSTAQIAADSLPYFLETGQSLILNMATPDLLAGPQAQASTMLSERLRSVPFFRQLYLLDAYGRPAAGYPEPLYSEAVATKEEKAGIQLALQGVITQTYTAAPLTGGNSAQVSFISAVRDSQGLIRGVLIGRTDLQTNPFTQPALKALEGLKQIGGQGRILDENNNVLYPASGGSILPYQGVLVKPDVPYEEPSPIGERLYSYYVVAEGKPWSVVLTVPASYVQQVGLRIAEPLLSMLLVVTLLVFLLLRYGLRAVTGTLRLLTTQALKIASGDLSQPVQVRGEDEVGRLAKVFEQMRASLKARLDELNRLLTVSQGVAANLEISSSIRPILEAALLDGACLSRVVLTPDVTIEPRQATSVAYGAGPAADLFSYLDVQLFEMMRQQDLLTLANLSRMRRIQIPQGRPNPGSLVAVAIRHENRYFGVFWVAYDQPRTFSEEEVRFLTTLSGEAALAASSARLYSSAEVGRQRLEAVLSSTPEPVLVFDENGRLLLLNPAALQVPGLITSAVEGQPIQQVVGIADLVSLLTGPLEKRTTTRELTLPNGKIYYTSVSAVVADGRPVGRVCLLRDITHFKELDQLKSDFVATVSHDLRSPLTLMRGYTTMLQMVGELNDQQKGYVKKIVVGIENMAKLVNNLLDLGRIEAGIGLQIERVIVQQVMEEVVSSLQLQATQKEIQLTQDIPSVISPVVIDADRALLQQSLYNLVENAIKYTPVGGKVRLRLESRPSTVLFQVHDNGIGIAPLDLPRLFEKFYRSGRREAYQQRGTGLGLAIVKSIVERHGGRVWVDSQLGKGSVFSMEMPIQQAQPELVVK